MAVLAIVFAFVFAPLAIVFGVIGRRQIRDTGEEGQSLATAGVVVGIVFTALGLILLAAYIVVIAVFVGHVHDMPDLPGPSANGIGT